MSLKLNLGCGLDKREGWVNIDIRKEVKPDLVLDLERECLPYEDNSVDEIMAKDVLEHFSWRRIEGILQDWHRVLKPGGKLFIQTPNLNSIIIKWCNKKIEGWKEMSFWLYGEQNYPENLHKCIFTETDIFFLLERIGFKVEKIRRDNTNLLVWAYKGE